VAFVCWLVVGVAIWEDGRHWADVRFLRRRLVPVGPVLLVNELVSWGLGSGSQLLLLPCWGLTPTLRDERRASRGLVPTL
jgi:hypothetical protein